MPAPVKHIVKKVTLELIYQVVDERTRELKEDLRSLRQEYKEDIKSINSPIDQIHARLDQMRQDTREDIKSLNSRIDQIHTRLDQIMHMLTEIRR